MTEVAGISGGFSGFPGLVPLERRDLLAQELIPLKPLRWSSAQVKMH